MQRTTGRSLRSILSRATLAAAAMLPARAARLPAQQLTLAAALDRADEAAYANRLAEGDAAERAATVHLTNRVLLPAIRAEASWVRTTDPLAAFGILLRQRAVTPAAFDPAALNDPAAITNVGTALVVEQPLLNLDGWAGRRAARRASEASDNAARWTRSRTRARVVAAWYGAVVAGEQVRTLEAAAASAELHARDAAALVRNGLATRSDELSASVAASRARTQLAEARSGAAVARRTLAQLLAFPVDTILPLPDSLPGGTEARRVLEAAREITTAASPRADVTAAHLAVDATAAASQRATLSQLPHLNAVGRLDWNAPGTPFGGRSAWTVAVAAQWAPFSGGLERAERMVAVAQHARAEAAAALAESEATLEVQRTAENLEVAGARLAEAEASVAQAMESHRIVGRKYAGGNATISELLDASVTETATRLAWSDARLGALLAATERRLALGLDVIAPQPQE